MPEGTGDKISKALIGHPVYKNQDRNSKISESLSGRKLSPEHAKKCGNGMRGKKLTEAHKSLLREKSIIAGCCPPHPRGENHPRWIADRTKLSAVMCSGTRWSYAYLNWRTSVLKRDNYECRIKDESCSGVLEVHHILEWRSFPELRYKLNNGITLCRAHHPRKRAEEKRLAPMFQELVSVSK